MSEPEAKMNDNIATPKMMDTGTIYVEVPICKHCNRSISRLAGSRDWVHVGSRSIYCKE